MRSSLRGLSLALVLVFGAAAPAAAFEAAGIAAGAADYQRTLERAAAQRAPADLPAIDTLRVNAADAARAQDWTSAVDSYQLLLGQAPDDAGGWLGLADALNRLDPYASRTLNAAYAAYQHASTDKLRASALTLIAEALEQQGRGRQAIAAAEEAALLAPSDAANAYAQQLRDQYGFRITDTTVENDRDAPQICINFSDPLATGRDLRYADYVRIEPEVPVEVLPSDQRICLEGVAFGQTYDVTVLPGIRSVDGDLFDRTDEFSLTVTDRPASVGFRGNAYVLPKTGEGTVPVTTVNVTEVKLRLLRINDRNLVDEIASGRFGQWIDLWSADDVALTSGEEVWTGTMPVEVEVNKSVVTGIPMDVMLPDPQPGVYVLNAWNAAADPEQEYIEPGTQWIVVTDIGLATFGGSDGLTVAARSLELATPRAGVTLTLLARNNAVLGESTTDAEGLAQFPAGVVAGDGGNRPAAVLAYAAGDFTFLGLVGSAFDLSDRGVSGRAEPGPLDAYLYTERGVYRPGESVALTALLRDERARAIAGLPLTIKSVRPDGVEARVDQVTDQGGGSYSLVIPLPDTAYTGLWIAEAYVDPKGEVIGSVSFQVEDFVPARIRVTLAPDKPEIRVGEATQVAVDAQFLYGAPAADLAVEAELVLQSASAPWPDHAGYQFGLVQDAVNSRLVPVAAPATDAEGKTLITVALDGLPDTTLPLEGVLRASVFDSGGRPANETVTLPVRGDRPWIGLKPLFDGTLEEGAEAGFEVIALDGDGQPTELRGVTWSLVQEIYDYQWYSTGGGSWDYRTTRRERPITDGGITIAAGAPARITAEVSWGEYRLDVYDPASGAASSVRFSAGWWVSDTPNPSPDKLEVALDKTSYAAGETARVHIAPPFAAEVLLLVANDRVLVSENVSVPEAGATIDITVGEDWGAGAYVLATAFRPMTEGAQARGPGRAVGVAWFGIDVTARTLTVDIEAPAEITPRQTIQVPVQVTGGPADQPTWITVAAVDEGILLLTDFVSPDPTEHYFGRRALGVEMRDAYGRLIVSEGERGTLRSGGDAMASQLSGLPERSSRTVALYSGIVALDAQGRAVVPLDIPDFNGTLRLMAVAWNAVALGAASEPLLVRDPIIAELSLPRFLAPGDTAELALSVRNLKGADGNYAIRVSAGGPLTVVGQGKSSADIAVGAESRSTISIRADALGVGTLTLAVAGPEGFRLDREWRLSVRPPQAVTTDRVAGLLEPGETVTLDGSLTAPYLVGTADVSASFSNRPNFDVASLLRALDRYPYGCAEQTTSVALPLLYLAEVAEKLGDDFQPDDIRRRVQGGIDRLMTMQGGDGSFGMWSVWGERNTWLTAYALDFLTRAREEGYRVPDRAYQRGIRFLSNYLDWYESRNECHPAGAYALYVTARAGAGDIGDMRYYADNCLPAYSTALARAQIGAAAAQFGDRARADAAFEATAGQDRPPAPMLDYGTTLRDMAATAALAREAGEPLQLVFDRADIAAKLFVEQPWHSTQEMAWMLLAARAVIEDAGPVDLVVDGQALQEEDGILDLTPTAAELVVGITVANQGDGPLRRVVSVRGVPLDPLPATEQGFKIERVFLDRAGRPFDPATTPVAQGDLVTVLIQGEATDQIDHRALIVDLLPAGFEIENPDLGQAPTIGDFADALSVTEHVEMRDDRYVAAVNLTGETRRFVVGYLARAVTPGRFVLPASFVEDMYLPQLHARTAMGEVTVQGRE